MGINIGGSNIGNVQIGGQTVENIFVGGNLVWTAAEPEMPGFGVRTDSQVFYSNSLTTAVGATATYYPFDYSSDIDDYITQGSTINLVEFVPGAPSGIRLAGTQTLNVGGNSVTADTGGFGGFKTYRFTLPNVDNAIPVTGFDGGETFYVTPSSAVSALPQLTFNTTLVGITPWVGNSFYTTPDITSLETIRTPATQVQFAGFLSNPVSEDHSFSLTATQGGVDVSEHIFYDVTGELTNWGVDWVQIGARPADLPGVGTIDIEIRAFVPDTITGFFSTNDFSVGYLGGTTNFSINGDVGATFTVTESATGLTVSETIGADGSAFISFEIPTVDSTRELTFTITGTGSTAIAADITPIIVTQATVEPVAGSELGEGLVPLVPGSIIVGRCFDDVRAGTFGNWYLDYGEENTVSTNQTFAIATFSNGNIAFTNDSTVEYRVSGSTGAYTDANPTWSSFSPGFGGQYTAGFGTVAPGTAGLYEYRITDANGSTGIREVLVSSTSTPVFRSTININPTGIAGFFNLSTISYLPGTSKSDGSEDFIVGPASTDSGSDIGAYFQRFDNLANVTFQVPNGITLEIGEEAISNGLSSLSLVTLRGVASQLEQDLII